MNKLRSAKLHLARFLFIVPLLGVILISFRQRKQDPEKTQVVQPVITLSKDTVPEVTGPNDKGYIIDVIDNNGNCTLVIKDKDGKQVDRLLLTKWNENENYYEEKYGKIPPPPPPVPPLPPGSPLPPKLPANVKSMQMTKRVATDQAFPDGFAEDSYAARGVTLAAGIAGFWTIRGPLIEALQWFRTFLAIDRAGGRLPDQLRAVAIGWANRLGLESGDLPDVEATREARRTILAHPSSAALWLRSTDHLIYELINGLGAGVRQHTPGSPGSDGHPGGVSGARCRRDQSGAHRE